MVVREGRFPDDLATMVDFQLALAKESEGMLLKRETVTKGVEAVFNDPSKGKYFFCEKAGEVIGCLLTVPEWSDWRNATVVWIHSVYVLPQFRGQGVYKKMYFHLKSLVGVSPNMTGIRLYVDKTNTSAQKVYQKLGMDNQHYDLYEWMI